MTSAEKEYADKSSSDEVYSSLSRDREVSPGVVVDAHRWDRAACDLMITGLVKI